jgi:hypothetical protein
MALLREVQQIIDRSVEHGALEEAREWGSLQYRVRYTVTRAMQRIAQSEHRRIHHLADSLTDLPAKTSAPLSLASSEVTKREPEPDGQQPPGPIQDLLHEGSDGPPILDTASPVPFLGRTAILSAAFVLSAAIWAATVWLPSTLREDPPRVSLSSLEDTDVVLAIVARPPSLYVDVDGAAWDALTHVQKRRRIEQVADVVSPVGFDGVLLRDESGRPVAQWIRGRGVGLLGSSNLTASSSTPFQQE